MNRRFNLLKQTLMKRCFGGSFYHWLLNCFSPTCRPLAERCISHISDNGDFKVVNFHNVVGDLYFNKTLNDFFLYQTITEQFYKWQWHYYQIPGTTVESDDVVFDCGCAEGLFTFLTYKHATHVYAFEPLSDYFDGLLKTFAHVSNVSLISQALGDSSGTAYLKKEGISSSITSIPTDTVVTMTTIDAFCKEKDVIPTYIKADLEGFELNLLNGAKETIHMHKPKIAITTYHVKTHAQEIKDLLLQFNPSYTIVVKGIESDYGAPVMLHAW